MSDSWDIYKACRELWGIRLKNEVIQRNGTVVVRPDSGPPKKIVPDCLDILGQHFGHTVNKKKYKVLPDFIRLIQGDSISDRNLGEIIDAILERGWSLDNVTFGSGGGLLQNANCGTQRFSMKRSYAVGSGKENELKIVFQNGKMKSYTTLDRIRNVSLLRRPCME